MGYKVQVTAPDGRTKSKDLGNWRDRAAELFRGYRSQVTDKYELVLTDYNGNVLATTFGNKEERK